MLTTILKNVTANWVGLIVNILLSFVIAPITVNALGSVYYGIWTLLMQFTGYLWLADFGVRESVVKYVAQYHASGQKDELTTTVRTAVSIYGLVALVAMVAVAGLTVLLPHVFNIPPEAVYSARIAAFVLGSTIAQSFVFNVFVGVVMGLQLGYRLAPFNLLLSITRAGLIYLLLRSGYGIVTLAVTQAVMTAAYSILVYRLCRAALPYLTVAFAWPRREDAAKLYHYGKFVLVTNVGEKIIFSTDSLVIAAFQPVSALTFYAIGGSLVEYLRSFVSSMGGLINPVVSGLEASRDMARLANVVIAGAKASVMVGLPVCIGLVLLGERFISLWMGPEFGPQAAAVLEVLAIGFCVALPGSTISAALYGLGRHRHVAYARIAEGVVNLTLSVVLVQRMGVVGVAIGTAVPQILAAGVYLPSLLPRFMPLDLKTYYVGTYLRPLVAAVPLMAACWAIDHVVQPGTLPLFFAWATAAILAYAAPCWLVVLTREERQRAVALVRERLRPARAVVPAVASAGSRGAE